MALADRVKNILLTPKTEWDVIAGETTPEGTLLKEYVLPLAAVAAIAAFIGSVFVGSGFGFFGYRMPLVYGLVMMVLQLAMAVVMVFVLAYAIDFFAPSFGAAKNSAQAFKVGVYSCTAAWVAGVLAIVPAFSVLALLGGLYGIYLLYFGLLKLMKSPEDRTAAYTAVVVVATIVAMVVINTIIGLIAAPALRSAATSAPRAEGGFDKGSPMAMSGSKRAEPLPLAEMMAFLPETLADLPKTGSGRSQRTAMHAKVQADYGDGNKVVRLAVTDAGGAAGLVGLAAWAGALNAQREDDQSVERTRKEGDRVVRERTAKRGGENEVGVILAKRFIVEAGSRQLDVAALKDALSGVDLAKLESLKDKGVAPS